MGKPACGRARRHAYLFATTILAAGIALPAAAQTAGTTPPPSRFQLDPNGVNLATGNMVVTASELSIGSSESALPLNQTHGFNVDSVDYTQFIYQNGTSWSATVPVAGGSRSYNFSKSGSTYTSTTGEAVTLVDSASGYVLTLTDGSQFTYGELTHATADSTFRKARLTKVIDSGGEQVTVGWGSLTYCSNALDGCSGGVQITAVRLQSVTNSYGYQLRFNYAGSGATAARNGNWYKLNTVVAINMAVDYCDPTALTCSLSQSWPTTSYAATTSGNVTTNTVTDALGRATRYTSDATPSAIKFKIKRPSSTSDNTVVSYDANYRVSSITTDGRTWAYSFTPSGSQMTTVITNPDSTTRTIVSDTNVGLPLSVKDELNRTITYTYDTTGRLTRATAPEGNYTQYTYDARGNVTEQRSVAKTPGTPADIVTSASYPASCANVKTCNQPDWTKDAKGNQTDYTYDGTHGGVLSVTAPAPTTGAVRPQTRYGYSALQAYYKNASGSIVASGITVYRLTSTSACRTQTSCAGGSDEVKATASYGPQSAGTANNLLPVSSTSGAGDGSLTATTAATYDIIGNLITVDGPLAGTADTARYLYDAARQRTMAVSPDPDGAGALKNRAVSVHYTPDGLVDLQSVGTSNADGSGFTTLQVGAAVYDASDRLSRSETRDGSGNVYGLTHYSYDTVGRLDCSAVRMNSAAWGSLPASACTAQTAGSAGPDRITKVAYNAAGQPLKTTSALGTSDQSDDSIATYTNNGQIQTLADANGNLTTYEYDGFDRLVKTRYPIAGNGAASSTTDYDGLTLDPNSNVISHRLRDNTSLGFGYDALNRATTKTRPLGEGTVTYVYDLLGRMTQASDTASSMTDTLNYDALGRLASDTQAFGSAAYQYDLAGRRTRVTWSDGFYAAYDYLVTGEMSTVRENGGLVLASFGYDDLGRRTSLTRGNGTVTTYTPDAVSRLQSLGIDLAGTGQDLTLGFSYNPAGQIASATRSNDTYAWTGYSNVNRAYGVNGLNQLTTAGGAALTYDARGNLTGIGSATYGYSSENLLKTASGGVSLYYDPFGRLAEYDTSTSTRFTYDGGSIMSEVANPGGSILRRYVSGPNADEVLAWYEGSGTADRRYLHADERGSIVAVTNDAGTAIATNSYDEYGVPGTANLGRFGYTGQAWLSGLNQWYYKARMYAPTLGRFMQTDPIGYGDGANWYNYVGSDPVNGSDSSGLQSDDVIVTGHLYPQNGAPVAQPFAPPQLNAPSPNDDVTVTAIKKKKGIPVPPATPPVAGDPPQNGCRRSGSVGAFLAPGAAAAEASLASRIAGALSAGAARLFGALGALLSLSGDTPQPRGFRHYGYSGQAGNFAGGLRPGSFATTASGAPLTGSQAQSLLALPSRGSAPDAYYNVTVGPNVPVVGPSTVAPANGQPGGGIEYTFPNGTPPGSVGPPNAIPAC